VSVVKINVLEVPERMRAELEKRFAGRAGMVEAADGFEWFELLRPVEGTDRYLVYTRWRAEEDFQAWHASQAFRTGHAQARVDAGGAGQDAPGQGSAGQEGAGQEGEHRPPAASGSQIWSFDVVQSTGPAGRG
jgi:heme oxygenase (mycobilin-producing)